MVGKNAVKTVGSLSAYLTGKDKKSDNSQYWQGSVETGKVIHAGGSIVISP